MESENFGSCSQFLKSGESLLGCYLLEFRVNYQPRVQKSQLFKRSLLMYELTLSAVFTVPIYKEGETPLGFIPRRIKHISRLKLVATMSVFTERSVFAPARSWPMSTQTCFSFRCFKLTCFLSSQIVLIKVINLWISK